MKVKTGLLLGAAAALVGLAGGVLHSTTATPIEGAYALTDDGAYYYDFVADFGTYTASGWSKSYAAHTLTQADLASQPDLPNATIEFTRTSKQTSTINTMPVLAAKEGNDSVVTFTLDDASKNIVAVELELQQWTAKKKFTMTITAGGATLLSEADWFTTYSDGTSGRLDLGTASNTVVFTQTATGNSNMQVGLKAIKVWTESTETPTVNVDKANIDLISKFASQETVTAEALNVGDNVTYVWSKVDEANALTLESEGATATLKVADDLAASTTVTVTVTATGSSGSASADVTVNCIKPMTVKEAKGVADDEKVHIGAYVARGNYSTTNYSTNNDIIDADAASQADSLMLYLIGDADLAASRGAYVCIAGTMDTYKGTRQVVDWSVFGTPAYSIDHMVSLVSTGETLFQCQYRYDIAKAHFLGMTEEEKTTFKTSVDTTIAAARERYETWASAMGDTNAYEATTGAFNGNFGNDGMTYTIIALSSLLVISLAGVAVYFAIRKKKANKA